MSVINTAPRTRQLGYLLLGLACLLNGGCLLVAAGAAGGAAVGYAYVKGRVCQVYGANLGDAWAATRSALADLGMPVVREEHDGGSGFLESRTADGDRVRIYLEPTSSRIPAEGTLTRVSVRVATFGDQPVSDRLLDQISAHLAPAGTPGAAPPGVTPSQPPALGPAQPITPTAAPPQAVVPASVPAQTAPPPLLPPEAAPRK